MKQEREIDISGPQLHAAATLPRRENQKPSEPVSQAGLPARIESLLLGLHLRGRLTPGDRELLNCLTDETSTCFLFHNGRFSHPDGLNVLPLREAETTLNSGSTATFWHRVRSEEPWSASGYHVYTAVLDPAVPSPIVLGLVCSEAAPRDRRYQRPFGDLVFRFRKAGMRAGMLIPGLDAALAGATPIMVVDRDSGQVMAANEPLCSLLKRVAAQLVDMEYSELKRDLSRAFPDLSFRLDNIGHGSVSLTLVSLQRRTTDAGQQDRSLFDFFIHRMRGKIAAVTSAAWHLDSLHVDHRSREFSDLPRIVRTETAELDRYLTRMSLLSDFQKLKKCRLAPADELERAVGLVRSRLARESSIEIATPAAPATVVAPAQALTFFFEALIRSHLGGMSRPTRTTITCSGSAAVRSITICCETTPIGPGSSLEPHSHWKKFTTRLADLMSISVSHQGGAGDHRLVTTAEIPC
ncbi:MAG TPA: hypothetical protein VMY05_11940 [Acidobacteriota bacterium]|nr:hypothetical protein [Acidobacteriota bacterium]